jgi:diguanylate cyclase (GGDEF)-like protein
MSDSHVGRRWLSRGTGLGSRPKFSRRHAFVLGGILLILIIQRIGFEVLGSSPAGTEFADGMLLLANCLAIGCCVVASLRGQGTSRIFWILLGSASVLELVANGGWAYYHISHAAVSDTALFPSLFYRLEAAPLAIALFLSEESRHSKLESFLDGCMVVGLVGVTTYQVQMAEVTAHDPKIWQLIGLGTAVNAILAAGAIARYYFSASGSMRGLFGRQSVYLSIYLAISFMTSFVDAYLPNIDASFDLIWIVLDLTIAALAITWRPVAIGDQMRAPRIRRRTALLCFNLTLASMVLGSAVLGLRHLYSTRLVGLTAMGVVLFAFAVRSALMQDTQEKYLAALHESQAELERQALYDELTGLPNRRLLAERLIQVLAIAERERHLVALLYLDLDGFKEVNDQFGHPIGDLLLKQVAQRILLRVRKSDTPARMGGDEFTWLASHISSKDEAARLGEEMLRSLSAPYEIEGETISITASIGIGLYPEDSTDPPGLIELADIAMYSVKNDGKNGVRYYAPELGNK